MKLSTRLNGYFETTLANYLFVHLTEEDLEPMEDGEFLADVPLPLKEEEEENLRQWAKTGEGEAVSPAKIAVNMAYVLGCNPEYPYKDAYLEFMKRLSPGGAMFGVLAKAAETEADAGRLYAACIYFRAALVLRGDDLKAMYGYAMALQGIYNGLLEGKDPAVAKQPEEVQEIIIGNFKAEYICVLEEMTLEYPDFAEGFYFLGYAYLNMGLYIKADLTFRDFLKLATDAAHKDEIRRMREQLKGPVEIEEGINCVISGRYDEGIEILEAHADEPKAKEWWPLHYYLGEGYLACGRVEEATAQLKRTLALNPAHMESMEDLVSIYEKNGDETNAEKYRKKLKLIRSYEEEDRQNNK